jgi:hypothetical protein
MTDTGLPPAAVQAVAEALAAGHRCDPAAHERDARAVLESAAPHFEAEVDRAVIAATGEATTAERERIAPAVRELLAAAMDYFNEMGACVEHPPPMPWASEARYAQAEAAIVGLIRQEDTDA